MSNAPAAHPDFSPISWRRAVWLALGAAACFHAAYTPSQPGVWSLAIIGYVACVIQLARLQTTRQSFYTGLATGFACFAPQLIFFWNIFGAAAIALWLVLAFWLGLFVALAHLAMTRLGPTRAALLIPFLWTGLEYFRSELYYLKFSWLNVGYVFAEWPLVPIGMLGMYGIGFAVANLILSLPLLIQMFGWKRLIELVLLALALLVLVGLFLPLSAKRKNVPNLVFAGIQLEFPSDDALAKSLRSALAESETVFKSRRFGNHTNLDLIVLPEYTLDARRLRP